LAGTIAVATWLASLDRTLNAAFDTVFSRIDLLVSAGADPFAVEATRIPGGVADEIASLPQVAYVDAVRINTMAFAGSLVSVVAGDATLYARGQRTLHMVEGESATVGRELASGSSVVVNQTFVSRFQRRKGDMLDLVTPGGPVRVRIAGIYLELAPGDLATIHLDRALYHHWWRDDTASLLAVSLKAGVDRGRVIDLMRRRWGDRRLVVLTLEQMRDEYQAMLRHLAVLVEPLVGFAILVALVGIVSARVASMMARIRSSGVLRVVGATRGQLARVFVIEAAIVGTIAATFAAVAGSVLGRMQVDILLRGMLGMSILYAYPGGLAILGGIGVVVLTTGAGWVLGRHAGGFSVSEALRWD
jgi:putative ABC transport system permease protein